MSLQKLLIIDHISITSRMNILLWKQSILNKHKRYVVSITFRWLSINNTWRQNIFVRTCKWEECSSWFKEKLYGIALSSWSISKRGVTFKSYPVGKSKSANVLSPFCHLLMNTSDKMCESQCESEVVMRIIFVMFLEGAKVNHQISVYKISMIKVLS